jgi:hypothetical protein
MQALSTLAGLGLAGCDDGTIITRVDVRGDAQSFFVLAGPHGLATEVHGAPYPGTTSAWVVERLKAPPALPTGIRFRDVGIGTARNGPRLVLVFNRRDAPDPVRDCGRMDAAPVDPPEEAGFSATATLCNAHAMVATAHMEARRTGTDDPDAFPQAMRLLIMQIAAKAG